MEELATQPGWQYERAAVIEERPLVKSVSTGVMRPKRLRVVVVHKLQVRANYDYVDHVIIMDLLLNYKIDFPKTSSNREAYIDRSRNSYDGSY